MENIKIKFRAWPASLPYALDYLLFVLLAAFFSFAFFLTRLESRLWAMILGMTLTLLAAYLLYHWQKSRWLRRKKLLTHRALALWLTDFFLGDNVHQMDEWIMNILGSRPAFRTPLKGRPLISYQGAMVRLYSLRRHPSCPADAQQIMQMHNAALCSQTQGALIVSTAGFTEAAYRYALDQPSLVLMDMQELAAQAQRLGVPLPRFCREAYLNAARKELLKEKRQRHFTWPRQLSKRLAMGAILLAILTVFLPHKLWPGLLAGLSAAGAVFFALTDQSRW